MRQFQETNDTLYHSAWKSQFLSGLMQPIMMFVGNLGYAAVALSGGLLAIRGTITIGDIQAFIQYVKNFTQPMQQIAQVLNQVQSMAAATERVFEFLEEDEEVQTAEHRYSWQMSGAAWISNTFPSAISRNSASSTISAPRCIRDRKLPLLVLPVPEKRPW